MPVFKTGALNRSATHPSKQRRQLSGSSPRRERATALTSRFGLVQGDGGAKESLQRLRVDLLALVEVDGAPRVPVKTGVEETRRIFERRAFGKGHLHDVLVGLAGADQPVMRPHRNPSPL